METYIVCDENRRFVATAQSWNAALLAADDVLANGSIRAIISSTTEAAEWFIEERLSPERREELAAVAELAATLAMPELTPDQSRAAEAAMNKAARKDGWISAGEALVYLHPRWGSDAECSALLAVGRNAALAV